MPHPDIMQLFSNLMQKSLKLDTYFPVYQSLLEKYRDKPNLVFVEVGVKNGGSLVLWREFFGPSARIIGIDYNPTAAQMRDKGFEIYIADQGSTEFWEKFFREVGPIDVLLDDGGHTNKHQITTVECALDHINDGGMILVEDTCTSYMKIFGNPSRYSFMNYAKLAADKIQSRSCLSQNAPNRFSAAVHSISFFESMVAFSINRPLCSMSKIVYSGTKELSLPQGASALPVPRPTGVKAFLRKLGLKRPVDFVRARRDAALNRYRFFEENQRLRKYF